MRKWQKDAVLGVGVVCFLVATVCVLGGCATGESSSGASSDANGARAAWIVGSAGQILSRGYGDSVWQRENSHTDSDLDDVACADALHVWAVGENGTIVASVDSGKTWVAQRSRTDEGLRAVCCVDAKRVWAAGSNNGVGMLLSSTNGGSAWRLHRITSLRTVSDIVFTDALHGWLVGRSRDGNCAVLVTVDGGCRWRRSLRVRARYFGVELAAIAGRGSDAAVAVGTAGTGDITSAVAYTTKSGLKWGGVRPVAIKRENSTARGVAVDARGGAWAVGSYGSLQDHCLIVASGSVGSRWKDRSPGVVGSLANVSFFDNVTGWAVGEKADGTGLILETNDGGVSWTSERAKQTIAGCRAVCCTTAEDSTL